MTSRIAVSVFAILIGCGTASAMEADSTFVSDTSRLVLKEGSMPSGMEFGGRSFPGESIMEYYDGRMESMMETAVLPVFNGTVDIRPYYTKVYSFNGFVLENYGTMPLTGALHAFLGRRDIDMPYLFRYDSAYIGAGVQIAPWLEVNGGGTFGMSMLRDRKPLPVSGGMMSVVIRPSENASMMVWGSYSKLNAIGAPTFNPVAVPHINIGASAKFRIGDATVGVGASVSTYGR